MQQGADAYVTPPNINVYSSEIEDVETMLLGLEVLKLCTFELWRFVHVHSPLRAEPVRTGLSSSLDCHPYQHEEDLLLASR